MTETVSSRSWISLLGTSALLAIATICWLVSAQTWAPWVALAFGVAGVGMAYRLLLPIEATLTVDAEGIRWSIAQRRMTSIAWADIRHLRQSEDDGSFRLDVGRMLEAHIPMDFLRTEETRTQFLGLVAIARPELGVNGSLSATRRP